ncbi:hydroxymethylbilane synthase [Leadbetterella byssophila DSM 17132]|uniref:Hydroxymethylbilane synthase n=1 Tax=Leadbetterella byssophila (strain DSM 17132 / JCM 16389 / KACC 11308 / NBRC 106382 / 4M15) TaxID=649349 RepID=E4RQ21_LEAB4|nr:hydroxymethylbilane synthase [Leadbetterella byssophila]ADQ16504.1 hydroxymethylbilane synthase [Leadbetterella byssophila DSM 17132]
MKIRIGTRVSLLAMWQANYIKSRLEAAGAETEIVGMETKGDKVLDVALSKIGSKGVFTEELEEKLLNGEIHIAVHSAKDMQSSLAEDFELIAFTEREYPGDVLVADRALDLSAPITIGTSSVRRIAFFKKHYPHIKLVNMRGNLQTRIQKMRSGQCDGLALAYAGVHRMEYDELIVHRFPLDQFIPPVGQGTVTVEIAKNLDENIKTFVKNTCNDENTYKCLQAERAFLKEMNGGCSIPVFGHATLEGEEILFKGGITNLEGTEEVSMEFRGTDPILLGQHAAEQVLQNGGAEILKQIRA